VRIIICSAALFGFLWLLRSALSAALDAFGFWPYIAICVGLLALTMAAAFAWDRYEARR
jgi:hypothetical protein